MTLPGPQTPDTLIDLGWARAAQRRYDEAIDCFRRATILRRASRWWPGVGTPAVPADGSMVVSSLKLDHDIEQFRYLASRNLLPGELAGLADHYDALRAEIARTYGTGTSITLAHGFSAMVDATYRRILQWRETPRISGSVLGPSLDRDRIEAQYAVPPGVCWVDGLLASQTLAALRAFCHESTIWNDIDHDFRTQPVARGYLGTYGGDGFFCPLLFQVADELTLAFPAIFKNHGLSQMWAYKYEPTLEGISLHGDDAAVNVNFWITPDDANLDPDSGGLVVHPVEAPADWNFDDMNAKPERIRAFLDGSGVTPVNIPYRQNRAVIFNSDLFHTTARLHFKPGYENRRINITMLFGRRGG